MATSFYSCVMLSPKASEVLHSVPTFSVPRRVRESLAQRWVPKSLNHSVSHERGDQAGLSLKQCTAVFSKRPGIRLDIRQHHCQRDARGCSVFHQQCAGGGLHEGCTVTTMFLASLHKPIQLSRTRCISRWISHLKGHCSGVRHISNLLRFSSKVPDEPISLSCATTFLVNY
jgi:hypothetical protein